MARRGRPTVQVELSGEDRTTLQHWAGDRQSPRALVQRCRIVLACGDGHSNTDIAADLDVNPQTVSRWRRRFASDRLDGLVDAPRRGPRTLSDATVAAIVADTVAGRPDGAPPWTTRSLAAQHGISHQTVADVWRAFGLKPPPQGPAPWATDHELVDLIEEVVAVSTQPAIAVVGLRSDAGAGRRGPGAPTLPAIAPPALSAGDDAEPRSVRAPDDFTAFLSRARRSAPERIELHVLVHEASLPATTTVLRWLLRHQHLHLHLLSSEPLLAEVIGKAEGALDDAGGADPRHHHWRFRSSADVRVAVAS